MKPTSASARARGVRPASASAASNAASALATSASGPIMRHGNWNSGSQGIRSQSHALADVSRNRSPSAAPSSDTRMRRCAGNRTAAAAAATSTAGVRSPVAKKRTYQKIFWSGGNWRR